MAEIIRASGTESKIRTFELLQGIIKRTRTAFRALEVVVLPDGSYVFQLKPEYSASVRRYASRPILPNATLKTLSYILLMQPISSTQIVEVRGSGAYAHLKELYQLDFITYHAAGRLRIYNTTEKLQKYFGWSGNAEDLKEKLFSSGKKTTKRKNKDV